MKEMTHIELKEEDKDEFYLLPISNEEVSFVS
jgi:hypothetical protein